MGASQGISGASGREETGRAPRGLGTLGTLTDVQGLRAALGLLGTVTGQRVLKDWRSGQLQSKLRDNRATLLLQGGSGPWDAGDSDLQVSRVSLGLPGGEKAAPPSHPASRSSLAPRHPGHFTHLEHLLPDHRGHHEDHDNAERGTQQPQDAQPQGHPACPGAAAHVRVRGRGSRGSGPEAVGDRGDGGHRDDRSRGFLGSKVCAWRWPAE